MDRGVETLSLADRQIENRGRNQSVNVQAKQCMTDFTKGGRKKKLREGWIERRERGRDVANSCFHL